MAPASKLSARVSIHGHDSAARSHHLASQLSESLRSRRREQSSRKGKRRLRPEGPEVYYYRIRMYAPSWGRFMYTRFPTEVLDNAAS